MKLWLPVVMASCLLSGCGSLPVSLKSSSAPAANEEIKTAVPVDENAQVVLAAIPDAKIEQGECGYLLWTLDAERPVPVMKFTAGGEGEIFINQMPEQLSLVSATGASAFGVYEEMEFQSATGSSVSVTMQFGQGFDGGVYLQRGVINMENADGWRSVTPAAGIAGCRA